MLAIKNKNDTDPHKQTNILRSIDIGNQQNKCISFAMIMWNRKMEKKQIPWQLCYKDTDSFVVYIKAKDIYIDIGKDIEKRLDISNYELERPSPKRKNKKSNRIN